MLVMRDSVVDQIARNIFRRYLKDRDYHPKRSFRRQSRRPYDLIVPLARR